MGTIAQSVAAVIGEAATRPWAAVSPELQQPIAAAIAASELPACVAEPGTEADLAAVMTTAHGEGWRILPLGSGSKLTWGHPVAAVDLAVSTRGLNRILGHAVGDLTVTVEAGVTFGELEAQLAQTGQTLGLDPAYPDLATLGGIVATADTGALRQRYGGVRDRVIGITLVRHDGELAKAGGRVVKNVAGYDLMKLMTGSYGTLGLISQLTLRTYPQPATSKTLLIQGSATEIAALTAEMLRSPLTPVALDIVTPRLLGERPQDANHYGLAVQFRSIAAGVKEQAAELEKLAATQSLTDSAESDLWQQFRHSLHPEASPFPEAGVLLKLGILPTEVLPLLTWLADHWGSELRGRFHCWRGIGQVWLPTTPDVKRLKELRSRCQNHSGYCSLLTAPLELKQAFDPWGLSPDTRRIMAKLQAQFDPQQRLSPQRWGRTP